MERSPHRQMDLNGNLSSSDETDQVSNCPRPSMIIKKDSLVKRNALKARKSTSMFWSNCMNCNYVENQNEIKLDVKTHQKSVKINKQPKK